MSPPRPGRRAVLRALAGAGLAGAALAGSLTVARAGPPPPRPPGRLRLACFNAALTRRGPGLLLRDILGGADAQVAAAADVCAAADADVLLLTALDWDHDLHALAAFAERLAARGAAYPHRFALRPNTGLRSGLDLSGDGRRHTPDDAQGYGAFAGVKGMGLLSRLPVLAGQARDFSGFLWADLPGTLMPPDTAPEVRARQRLSTTGHWDVPVQMPGDSGPLHILAWYATPPLFGGPQERNRRRNHDETRFWSLLLDGALPMPPPAGPFALMGSANLDPEDGEGMHAVMRALLAHPALQDPAPRSRGAPLAVGPRDAAHRGDPALDTTHWQGGRLPGNLRVDYVLPAATLRLDASGVLWPPPDHPLAAVVEAASRHRLVWADIRPPA